MNTTIQSFPGIVAKVYPYPGYRATVLQESQDFRVRVKRILQNFQKFGVPVRMSYRTSRSSGYCGTGVQNSQKFRAGTKHAVLVPRVLWPRVYRTYGSSGYRYECRTQLPEVPGTGTRILQNFQKFGVRVRMSYRTPRSSGYCGTGVQNSQKFRAGTKHAVLVPRVL